MIGVDFRIATSRGLDLAVTAHVPDDPRAVLFCGHGGSYTRRYWDFRLAGHPGYSFADALTARGYAVVAWDDPCTGESSTPDDPWAVTSVEVASAVADVVAQATERLSLATLPSIGVGHSLGGLLTIRRQARHRPHDALAILGWTNLGLKLTPGWWGEQLLPLIAEELPDAGPLEIEQNVRRIADQLVRPDPIAQRREARPVFHWDDVPEAVLEADDALAQRRAGTTQFIGQIAGIVAEDAAAIDVPIFLGFGERDVSPDPWREPATYPSCKDMTFHVLPRSGHCHNFASTRALQWARLATWLDGLVA